MPTLIVPKEITDNEAQQGTVVRGELGLMPDATLCDNCWKIINWTLVNHWAAENKKDDCGEDK